MANAVTAVESKKGGKGLLLALAATALLGAGGFASSFLSLWSPLAMLTANPAPDKTEIEPKPFFATVPRIEMTIPGSASRSLTISIALEITGAEPAAVTDNMPRIIDAFNGLFASIDAAAYDRRGILEVIRSELLSRARYILGDEQVKSVLVTEYLIK